MLAAIKTPAIPGLFSGVVAAALMAFAQGDGLGDIINAMHYGYEAGISSQFASAQGDALMQLISQTGLVNVAPEMAQEVGQTLTDLLTRGGLDSMMWSISLVMCALFFGGVMEACGFLEVIVGSIMKMVKSIGGIMATVIASCFISNLFLGDQYLSIVIPGRMFKVAFEKVNLAPRMLSRALEDAGTLTSPLIPWNTCGAFQSSALGVPTLSYLPYAFLNYLNPLVSILISYMKIGIYWRTSKGEDVVAREYPG